jgi:hypothetical protein
VLSFAEQEATLLRKVWPCSAKQSMGFDWLA